MDYHDVVSSQLKIPRPLNISRFAAPFHWYKNQMAWTPRIIVNKNRTVQREPGQQAGNADAGPPRIQHQAEGFILEASNGNKTATKSQGG
jgi:hypothetical protein